MSAPVTNIMDLSFLSIVEDGPDDFIVGNGQTFINVPGIAVTVISMIDGTRTAQEAREETLRVSGVDVDVEDFISGLDEAGLLNLPAPRSNLWDQISPRQVSWLFSRPANVLVALLAAAGLAVDLARPGLAPIHYLTIVTRSSSFTFILTFVISSWVLVFIHEFSHILAARSLGVHAELSFGTRMQFLVAQTNVTGIWQTPLRRRYRVHLAGMRTDLALLSIVTCVLPFVHSPHIAATLRVIALIWLGQIVWQFLFFMRTDIYYAYANFTHNRNLMEDAASHLRAALRRRASAAPKGVRAYAWFLIAGQMLGIVYFAGYTVPVTVVLAREALHQLARSGFAGKAEALFVLGILAITWTLFAFLVLRSQHRRIAAARRAAPTANAAP